CDPQAASRPTVAVGTDLYTEQQQAADRHVAEIMKKTLGEAE
ncbi:EmrA/EmrK family multidrug efflux transporter periplasmic adaptor subunit, partial [Acetobacter sp. DmW_125123]